MVVHVCGLSTLFNAAIHNAMVNELLMMAPWSSSSRSTSSTAAVSGVIMAERAACLCTWSTYPVPMTANARRVRGIAMAGLK